MDDDQSDAFIAAANRGGYKCKLTYTAEAAMEYYMSKLPEVCLSEILAIGIS